MSKIKGISKKDYRGKFEIYQNSFGQWIMVFTDKEGNTKTIPTNGTVYFPGYFHTSGIPIEKQEDTDKEDKENINIDNYEVDIDQLNSQVNDSIAREYNIVRSTPPLPEPTEQSTDTTGGEAGGDGGGMSESINIAKHKIQLKYIQPCDNYGFDIKFEFNWVPDQEKPSMMFSDTVVLRNILLRTPVDSEFYDWLSENKFSTDEKLEKKISLVPWIYINKEIMETKVKLGYDVLIDNNSISNEQMEDFMSAYGNRYYLFTLIFIKIQLLNYKKRNMYVDLNYDDTDLLNDELVLALLERIDIDLETKVKYEHKYN